MTTLVYILHKTAKTQSLGQNKSFVSLLSEIVCLRLHCQREYCEYSNCLLLNTSCQTMTPLLNCTAVMAWC